MLNVPATLSESGKRERYKRANRRDALKLQRELKKRYHEQGTQAGIIPSRLAAEAQEAAEMLKPYKANLLDAAREYVAARKVEGATKPLSEAWADYQDYLERENKSASSKHDYARTLRALPQWFLERVVASLTKADIEKALDESIKTKPVKRGPTWNRRLRETQAVIAEATRTKAKAAKLARKAPKILTVEEAKTFMMAAEEEGCALPCALMLFAGIRPEAQVGELSRMTWDWVDKEHITVPLGESKTESDRLIPIMPNLRAWLDACKGQPIVPPRWAKKIQKLRALVGIGSTQDVPRHTFGSCFYKLRGEAEVVEAMGHTSIKTTLRFYKKAVTNKQAQAFFSIAPKGVRVAKPPLLRAV